MRRVKIDNPRYPHSVKITRIGYADRYSEENSEAVLWEGPGRCYTNGAVEGRSVDVSRRYLSIPVRFDGWRPGNYPASGDSVTVTMGAVTETMTITDVETDNNRTVLYCERNGNADL